MDARSYIAALRSRLQINKAPFEDIGKEVVVQRLEGRKFWFEDMRLEENQNLSP